MNLCLVGPGIMPIPPNGWGSLERHIWDRACILKKLGHEVEIVNTSNTNEIIHKCLDGNFDVIHIHYDVFYTVIDFLHRYAKCPILFSSHYPYINQPEKHFSDNYGRILSYMLENSDKFYNFASSPKDYSFFLQHGVPTDRLFWLMEGPQDTTFRYNSLCENSSKSIYLGKIDERKKQYKYQTIEGLEFVGRYCGGTSFNKDDKSYRGEWDREQLCNDLTSYANMVMLSDGENGTPLVIKEALISGLGVVVSKHNIDELDVTLDFIELIPDEELDNLELVRDKVFKNREISINKRDVIREYGMKKFSLTHLIEKYINNIKKILL